MSSRKVTPRGIIQGVLEANSITKSAVNTTRTRRRSLRRSLAEATPGTLIKGVLQTSSTAKKSPARNTRVLPTPPLSAIRKSSRIARLQSSGSQDPTPRGLIRGLLASTAPETPAAHVVVRTSTDNESETDVQRNAYQGRIADLISPDVDTPEVLSQERRTKGGIKRQRGVANIPKDAFQSGIHQRMQKDVADVSSFSDSTLHSIPEESEVRQTGRTTTANDEDVSSQDEMEVEIASLAQLATQPQTAGEHEELDILQDTSAVSLSNMSFGEVAAANTIQVHQVSDHQSMTQPASENSSSTEEDEPSSAKRQRTLTEKNSVTAEQRGTTQDVVNRSGTSVVQDGEGTESPAESDEMLDISQPEAENLDGNTSDVSHTNEDEEQDISSIFSPMVTPSALLGGRRKTPAAKTPAAYKSQGRRAQPPGTQRTLPRRRRSLRKPHALPMSLTKSIFTHFSNGSIAKGAWEAIEDCTDKFLEQVTKDLAHYSSHAKRKTIHTEDVILLMKRQGHVSDMQSFYALVEKYLSMEQRRELIPCALAGGGTKPDL
ncbi:uncharacterized protein [Apostichopus japonicus]|uniref:uncharacterized protein n=1 Tax=Stichopus japonicus TaxID=307972 RepID=UPI003AB83F42